MNNYVKNYERRQYEALMNLPDDHPLRKYADFILRRDYGEGDEVYGIDSGEAYDRGQGEHLSEESNEIF